MSKIKKLGLSLILVIIFALLMSTRVFADGETLPAYTPNMNLSTIPNNSQGVLNASGEDIINEYGGGKTFILDGGMNPHMAGGAGACIDPTSDMTWTVPFRLVGVADVNSNGGTFYGIDTNGVMSTAEISQRDAAFMAYGAAEMMNEGPVRWETHEILDGARKSDGQLIRL